MERFIQHLCDIYGWNHQRVRIMRGDFNNQSCMSYDCEENCITIREQAVTREYRQMVKERGSFFYFEHFVEILFAHELGHAHDKQIGETLCLKKRYNGGQFFEDVIRLSLLEEVLTGILRSEIKAWNFVEGLGIYGEVVTFLSQYYIQTYIDGLSLMYEDRRQEH